MALIKCPDCGRHRSAAALTCPSCGRPAETGVAATPAAQVAVNPRKVSVALIAGVVFVPYVFAWFLLRKGYSATARVVGLGWMALLAAITIGAATTSKTTGVPAPAASQTAARSPGEAKKANPNAALPMVVGASLKAATRNPESLVIERALANSARTFVCVAYRAQNGFGGMNREHAVFTKGGGDSSARAWNKNCTTSDLDTVTNEVKLGITLDL